MFVFSAVRLGFLCVLKLIFLYHIVFIFENKERVMEEISVQDFDALRKQNSAVNLIDVREPWEYEFCHIEGSKLIPMGKLADALPSLNQEERYVLHCRSGGRSANAVVQMEEAGFKHVENLKGGITAWAEDIDSSLPTY